jgi:hypothetical protein
VKGASVVVSEEVEREIRALGYLPPLTGIASNK